jgi:DNA (cytosine-5)-methyltransferase 1
MPRIKYGSDCSGIEAPYIALMKVLSKKDIQHIFASDIDAHVRDMIKANYNQAALYNSVAERPHTYVDFYFAGFPCQTFSIAGSRRGFEDVRGTVFFDIYAYLLTVKPKPKVVVLENVKGLLTHDQGRTFQIIMDLLHELGVYKIDYKVMSPTLSCKLATT